METTNPQASFGQKLGNASLQCLSILGMFFTIPYKLWCRAIDELIGMKQSSYLDLKKIDSPWPLLTFTKRLCFEAVFSFLSFLSYPIGLILALILGIKAGREFLIVFSSIVLTIYFAPFYLGIIKDFLQLFLIRPMAKFLSWLKKPAQYMDFTITNK